MDIRGASTCDHTPNDKGSFNVHDVCSFLRHVRLHKGVALGFSFQDPDPWTVYLRPKSDWTWQQIQDALEDLDQLPSLEERFGLGSVAAALLQWIESLDQSEWYRNLTPSVEDHLKTRIGLKPDCNRENLPVLVQMLIDEINEKTDYHLRIQIWKVYDRNSTRILVNQRTSDLDRIIREIQCFALKTDKVLMRQEVIDAGIRNDTPKTGFRRHVSRRLLEKCWKNEEPKDSHRELSAFNTPGNPNRCRTITPLQKRFSSRRKHTANRCS